MHMRTSKAAGRRREQKDLLKRRGSLSSEALWLTVGETDQANLEILMSPTHLIFEKCQENLLIFQAEVQSEILSHFGIFFLSHQQVAASLSAESRESAVNCECALMKQLFT